MWKKYNFSGLIWTAIIVVLCFLPGHRLPSKNLNIVGLDKLVHFVLYFILYLLLKRDLMRQSSFGMLKKNSTAIVFIYCLVLGAIVELVQLSLVESRQGDWGDMLANLIGALVALLLFKKIFPGLSKA